MKRPTIYLLTGCMSLIAGCLWLTRASGPGRFPGWLGLVWLVVGALWIVNYAVRRRRPILADAPARGSDV